jgi:hypothetical protein
VPFDGLLDSMIEEPEWNFNRGIGVDFPPAENGIRH